MCAVMSTLGLLPYWIGGECSLSTGTHTAKYLNTRFGININQSPLQRFFQTACKAFEDIGVKEPRVVEHIFCDAERAMNKSTAGVHCDSLIANQKIYVRDGKYVNVISSKEVYKVNGSLMSQFPYMGRLCYTTRIARMFFHDDTTKHEGLKEHVYKLPIPDGLDKKCQEKRVFVWMK